MLLSTAPYKPLILRVGDLPGLANPVFVFLAILFITGPLMWLAGGPLPTVIGLAYDSAAVIFITSSQRKALQKLRPCLNISDREFEQYLYNMDHMPRRLILGISAMAPVLFLIVNASNPRMEGLLSGRAPDPGLLVSMVLAILTWVVIAQMFTVIIRNVRLFSELGRNHAEINLLDLAPLAPIMSVGMSTFWVFVFSYTIVPLALINNPQLLMPVLLTIIITLPFAILTLVLPALTARNRIRQKKRREIRYITAALNGDRDALNQTHLRGQEHPPTVHELLSYREWIQRLSDWPINDSVTRRLYLFLILPISSWGFTFAVEQWILRSI